MLKLIEIADDIVAKCEINSDCWRYIYSKLVLVHDQAREEGRVLGERGQREFPRGEGG